MKIQMILLFFLTICNIAQGSIVHQAIPYLHLPANISAVRSVSQKALRVDLSKVATDYWDYLTKNVGDPNLFNLITTDTERQGFQPLGLTAQDVQEIKKMVEYFYMTQPIPSHRQNTSDLKFEFHHSHLPTDFGRYYSVREFAHPRLPVWLENKYENKTAELINRITSNPEYDFLGPQEIRASVIDSFLQEHFQRTKHHPAFIYQHKDIAMDINNPTIQDFKDNVELIKIMKDRLIYIDPRTLHTDIDPQSVQWLVVQSQHRNNPTVVTHINNLLQQNSSIRIIIAFDHTTTAIPNRFSIQFNASHLRIAGINIRQIGDHFLWNCTRLTALVLPASLTQVGDYFLWNCTRLTDLRLPIYLRQVGNYFLYFCTGLTDLRLPVYLRQVGDYFLDNCTGLTTLILPASLTEVGDGFLYNCTGLTALVLPAYLTQVGNNFLFACSNLQKITLSQRTKDAIELHGENLNTSFPDTRIEIVA